MAELVVRLRPLVRKVLKGTVSQRDTTIYALLDQNGGPRYVGKTNVSIERRMRQHIRNAKVGKPDRVYRWMRSMYSDGLAPSVMWIERVQAGDNWWDIETKWIELYRSLGYDLTNLTSGGGGCPGPTDEVRLKMRNAKLGHIKTEETRRKLSVAATGQVFTPERCANISSAKKGKPIHPNSRDGLKRAGIGWKPSAAMIAASRAVHIGSKHSPETIAKMKASQAKHPNRSSPEAMAKMVATKRTRGNISPSPEARAKQSAALKGRAKSAEHIEKASAHMRTPEGRQRNRENCIARNSGALLASYNHRPRLPAERAKISASLRIYHAKRKALAGNNDKSPDREDKIE